MIARELVSNVIPPLKTSDTGTKAIGWMNEFHVTHLPIVNNQEFLGMISEEDILNLNAPDEPLGNHELSLYRPYVNENQHLFEVIKTAATLKLSLIPVIDDNEKYIGAITAEGLVKYLASTSSINEPGGVLVLEVNTKDYVLSEISRIVESNDTKILAVYVSTHKDSTKMEVTLKLNSNDLKTMIATFERFDYNVMASFQESEFFDNLKDNYDSLMKYLDI